MTVVGACCAYGAPTRKHWPGAGYLALMWLARTTPLPGITVAVATSTAYVSAVTAIAVAVAAAAVLLV